MVAGSWDDGTLLYQVWLLFSPHHFLPAAILLPRQQVSGFASVLVTTRANEKSQQIKNGNKYIYIYILQALQEGVFSYKVRYGQILGATLRW